MCACMHVSDGMYECMNECTRMHVHILCSVFCLQLWELLSQGGYLKKYMRNGRGGSHDRWFRINVHKGTLLWRKKQNSFSETEGLVPLACVRM